MINEGAGPFLPFLLPSIFVDERKGLLNFGRALVSLLVVTAVSCRRSAVVQAYLRRISNFVP